MVNGLRLELFLNDLLNIFTKDHSLAKEEFKELNKIEPKSSVQYL